MTNKWELDPADGLTAFDGLQPDPILSQDAEVQDAANANNLQPGSASSKNGRLLVAAPNNNMQLVSVWNNDVELLAANNVQTEPALRSDGELLAAGPVDATFQQAGLST